MLQPKVGPFHVPGEKELAEKLFGKDMVLDKVEKTLAPNPLSIFCRDQKNSEFLGKHIEGFETKFCDDFVLAPTDVGLCYSNNFDVKEVFELDNQYASFLKAEEQSTGAKFKNGNYWMQDTFVINIEAIGLYPRRRVRILPKQ